MSLQLSRLRAFSMRLWLPLLVATLLRLSLFLVYQPWVPHVERTRVVQGDESSYHRAALNILAGHGYSYCIAPPYVPSNFRVPLFPFMLSVVYRVVGVRPWTVLLLHIVFSLLTLISLCGVCRIAFGTSTIAPCAWLAAFCPLDIVLSQTLLREPLTVLLLAFFWLCWVMFLASMRLWFLLVAGITLGCATLTRETSLILPAFLILALFLGTIASGHWKRSLLNATLLLITFFLPLAPWAYRNHTLLRTWSLSSAGGTTMLTGNAALLLTRKYHYDFDQMLHALHQVLLKRYVLPDPLPPEIQAGLRGDYLTNHALVAAITPPCFDVTNVPRIPLYTVPEISAAQMKLFTCITRREWPRMARAIVTGAAHVLLVPLWQELMRITLPALDSGRFFSAVIHADISYLRQLPTAHVAIALAAAALMTTYDVTVAFLACCGFWTFLRSHVNPTLRWSWLLVFFASLLLVAGPNATARFRAVLIPQYLPLAALGLATLRASWRARGVR